MSNRFRQHTLAIWLIVFAASPSCWAADVPAADQKPAAGEAVTRPKQIEPMVAPVKRAAPQTPENKSKAPVKEKAAAASKIAKSSQKAGYDKSGREKTGGKKTGEQKTASEKSKTGNAAKAADSGSEMSKSKSKSQSTIKNPAAGKACKTGYKRENDVCVIAEVASGKHASRKVASKKSR